MNILKLNHYVITQIIQYIVQRIVWKSPYYMEVHVHYSTLVKYLGGEENLIKKSQKKRQMSNLHVSKNNC